MMILRMLKRQPMHGYALVQQIKRTSQDLLVIEEGSLYPALQRLLKEEFVNAEWGVSSTNRQVRIYKLTARVESIWRGKCRPSSECWKGLREFWRRRDHESAEAIVCAGRGSTVSCRRRSRRTLTRRWRSWWLTECRGIKQCTPHGGNLGTWD